MFRVRGQVVLAAVLLLGYWGLLAWLPNPHDYEANLSPDGNVVARGRSASSSAPITCTRGPKREDRSRRTAQHAAAIVTALLGYWTGLFIQRRGVNYRNGRDPCSAAACVCAAIGQGWHFAFPINKKFGPAASCCSPAAWRWSFWPAAC